MKFKKFIIVIILASCFVIEGYSQQTKSVEHAEQIWLAYFNQARFSKRWGLWTDIHLRTKENFVEDLSQFIFRIGATYYLNDATKLTAGYAFVNHFPADNHQNISQPEHRIWQQVQWHTKYNKIRTMQYLRLEERFRHKILNHDELADGYNFNWRVRYNFMLQAPLSKKGFAPHTFSFVVNDEVHINFGDKIVYNTFDQNRFFIGFSYQTNAADQLQFGYMNVFAQLATGYQYRSINTARVYYLHNLDLRKKKAP
jgi:hypothetical protein